MEEQETNIEHDPQVNGASAPVIEPEVITPAPEVSATETSTPALKAQGTKISPRNTAIIAAIIFVIAAAGAAYVWHNGGLKSSSALGTTSFPAVVAVVNGENITGSDLQKSITQTQNVAQQQGANLTDPNVKSEIQAQALSSLVDSRLLYQAGVKAGITASTTGIDAQYAQIVTQFGGADKLAAQMKTDGITEADLRENIKEQTVIKEYLNTNPSFAKATVTDAEVSAAYDNFKSQSDSTSTPPLAQISDEIKQQLLQQKQQDAINAILDQLHASSTVKMNI